MSEILVPRGSTPEERRKDLLGQVEALKIQAKTDVRYHFSGYPSLVVVLCNTLEAMIKEAEQDDLLLGVYKRKRCVCIHNP